MKEYKNSYFIQIFFFIACRNLLKIKSQNCMEPFLKCGNTQLILYDNGWGQGTGVVTLLSFVDGT